MYTCFFLVMVSALNAAPDTLQLTSSVTDVTVFYNGATVTRSVPLSCSDGEYVVVVPGLILQLEVSSIQVGTPEGVTVLGMKHVKHPAGRPKVEETADEKRIAAAIKSTELKVQAITDEIGAIDLEERMLTDNSVLLDKSNGTSFQEIREMAEHLRERIAILRKERRQLREDEAAERERFQRLQREQAMLKKVDQRVGSELLLRLDAEKPIKGQLTLSYFVNAATWVPSYDFRVSDFNQPITVVYKAAISQSSGEDWADVKLTLAASNLKEGKEPPQRVKWDVFKPLPYAVGQSRFEPGEPGGITGRITDGMTDDPLPFVNVLALDGRQPIAGAVTDFDGRYLIKPLAGGSYHVEASYVGYNRASKGSVRVTEGAVVETNLRLNPSTELTEVVVEQYKAPLIQRDGGRSGATRESIDRLPARAAAGQASAGQSNALSIRGSRNDEAVYYVDGIRVRGSSLPPVPARQEVPIIHSDVLLGEKQIGLHAVEYAFERAQTVRSDGADHAVKIREVKLDAEYQHVATPIADSEVYVMARIADWEQLDLLQGAANIIFQNVYKGKVMIDPYVFNDTLELSLGADRSITVMREENRNVREHRILGSAVRETKGYNVQVRSGRDVSIKLVLQDQIPVSAHRAVAVELLEDGGARYDAEKGYLTWELDLAPGGSKAVGFAYSVRMPR